MLLSCTGPLQGAWQRSQRLWHGAGGVSLHCDVQGPEERAPDGEDGERQIGMPSSSTLNGDHDQAAALGVSAGSCWQQPRYLCSKTLVNTLQGQQQRRQVCM